MFLKHGVKYKYVRLFIFFQKLTISRILSNDVFEIFYWRNNFMDIATYIQQDVANQSKIYTVCPKKIVTRFYFLTIKDKWKV